MTTMTTAPALNPTTLYLGDNGRLFCGSLRCAGSSSYDTGRDLSGQPVMPLDAAGLTELRSLIGREPECEGCGRPAA